MKKLGVFIFCCIGIFATALFCYQEALTQSTYSGLPTVPCLDYTKPIVQNFSLTISLRISGKQYPLDATIGHGAGNCLYEIYTNDTSGTVYVRANDAKRFTLGQFFDVWGKAFTSNQIFQFRAIPPQTIRVIVDGHGVSTVRDTLLAPHQTIVVSYE